MASEVEIKAELLAAVNDKSLLTKVEEELDLMRVQEGADGKPLLFRFHKIWKDNADKTGRENAINSWAAYAIGMTEKKPDPAKEFLPQRRFFARKGFPDIDTDFDYEGRDQIYEYIIKKYGQERVGNIGTYQALKMKSYLHRVIKALDPTKAFFKYNSSQALQNYVSGKGKLNHEWEVEAKAKGDEIVKSLPPQRGAKLKIRDENGEDHDIKCVQDAYTWCPEFAYYMDQYPDILAHSHHIEGLLSIFGIHPAGIVISDVPLEYVAPLRRTKKFVGSGDKQEVVYATQFPNEDLELLGLIKFDILALSTLSVIARCVKMIKERYGITLDIRNLDKSDRPTLDLYQSGNLVGVFQAEEDGMQHSFRQVGCDRFEDVMAIIALYRPGPLDSIPSYALRKRGEEEIEYFHPTFKPFLEPYLKETYSIVCYQEQVMFICRSLAGFSVSDGYAIIKAVGKKIESLLKKYEKQFIDGCVKNGLDKDLAAKYWKERILPFASYGFNKSHSAGYAVLSFMTAYLKANYPEVFMCCYMNVETERAKYERVEQLEYETRRMGIEILPRSINKCKMEYEIVAEKDGEAGISKSQIRPTVMCKGLSWAAAQSIVANQTYKDLRNFAEKTDSAVVDKTSVESLVDAGFFDGDKNKKKIVDDFCVLRADLKKAKQKGIDSIDIFG